MGSADAPMTKALDWSLVDHDGLMTPRLLAHFGPINVQVLRTDNLSETSYSRMSRLCQISTGALILDAELVLNTVALPHQVLLGLRDTQTPFGQLVMEAGIVARSVDREITTLAATDGQGRRLGRRHRLVNAQTGQELCAIVETLSPLSVLFTALAAFTEKDAGHD